MLHRFSTGFIVGEFGGQLIVSTKFDGWLLLLLLLFFAPYLGGFGCVCWRPVLDEAFKVCPYLLCRRSLALLLSWDPQTISLLGLGSWNRYLRHSSEKKMSYSSAVRFLYCLAHFKPVARCVAVSRSFFCLQPSLSMNLQTVFFPRTGPLLANFCESCLVKLSFVGA